MSNSVEYTIKFRGDDGVSPVVAKVSTAVKTVTDASGKAAGSTAQAVKSASSAYSDAVNQLRKSGEAGTADLSDSIKTQKKVINDLIAKYDELKAKRDSAPTNHAKGVLDNKMASVDKEIEAERQALKALQTSQQEYAQSTTSVRTQIMGLRNEMAAMRVEGKENTSEYDQLRDRMEQLGTVYRELQTEQQALSTGATQWGGMISGLQGLMGAYSAGTGVVSLFVKDQDKLAAVQTKLQSVMSIMMGMQQTANTLHATSAFRIVTVRRATQLWTSANKALSTSLNVSSAAARGLTAAATLGASVLIGVVVSAINKYINKRREQRQADDEARVSAIESEETYRKNINQSAASVLASYSVLRSQYEILGDSLKAKEKFVNDNSDAFNALGISVNNVTDADNVFVANTDAVVAAIVERAKATAAQKKIEESAAAILDLQSQKEHDIFKATAGAVTVGDRQKADAEKQSIEDHYYGLISVEEAKQQEYVNAVIASNKAASTALSGAGIKTSGKGAKRNGATPSASYAAGTVGAYDETISELNAKIKQSSDSGEIAALQLQIELNEASRDRLLGNLKSWSESLSDAAMVSIPVQIVPQINKAVIDNEIQALAEEFTEDIKPEPIKIETKTDKAVKNINALSGAMNNLGAAVGGAAGGWMQWGANVMQAISQALPQLAALTMAQKEQGAAAGLSATLNGMNSVASVPYVGPVLAIAAMASIVAAIASIPKFAAGGIAYGPTIGLFGEYSGAQTNPEVVAPLDRLRSIIQPDGGNGGTVEFRLRGRNLYGTLKNDQRFRRRTR